MYFGAKLWVEDPPHARDLSTDTAHHYGQLNEGNVFSATLSDVSNNITISITENSSQNLAVEISTETEDQ